MKKKMEKKKKWIWILLILFALLTLYGCKPKQVITEKVIYKVDSTSMSYLQSELNRKTAEAETLKTNLERLRDEITTLQSNLSIHEINYDTAAVVKPDGYYPIASEVKTENVIVYENKIQEKEKLITELNNKVENLTKQNSELTNKVNILRDENSQLSEKTEPQTGFNFRLFFIGVAVGIVLYIVVKILIKRFV